MERSLSYAAAVKESAEKELRALPKSVLPRMAKALRRLEAHPRHPGSQKLQGHEAYRIRVGNYRVLYLIDDKARQVDIISIADRKDVYRDL